jgi:hypothetical protein
MAQLPTPHPPRRLSRLTRLRTLRPRRPAREALREQLGWTVVAVGAGLCFLGWYGVSGERYTAQQLPYLASATAPGAALLLGGFGLLAARQRRAERPTAEQERMIRQLELLYRLLTEEATTAQQPGPASAPQLLAVPGGRTYHRADCLLLQGRDDARPAAPGRTGLNPCPLCDPPATQGS